MFFLSPFITVGVVLFIFWLIREPRQVERDGESIEHKRLFPEEIPKQVLPPGSSSVPPRVVRSEDRHLLWENPASPDRVVLPWIPPGTQWLLYLRVAELMASPEMVRTLQAFGVDMATLEKWWIDEFGITLLETISCQLALGSDDAGTLQSTVAIELKEIPTAWRLESLGFDQEGAEASGWCKIVDNRNRFVRQTRPYLLVKLLPGLSNDSAEYLEGGGSLQRDLESLSESVGKNAQFLWLATPSYAFREGKDRMPKEWHPLFRNAEERLVEKAKGLSLAIYLLPHELFVEGQVTFSDNQSASTWQAFCQEFEGISQERLDDGVVTDQTVNDKAMASAQGDPHWQPALDVLKFIESYRRESFRGRRGTLQWSIPVSLAPEGVLAIRLALSRQRGARGVAAAARPTHIPWQETILKPLSVTIAAQPLESMVGELIQAVNQEFQLKPEWTIRLDGPSFEAEGITRNQQISRFEMRMQPLSGLLTELAMRANPDKSPRKAHDPLQKVVWVIQNSGRLDRTDTAGPVVWITTKQGASHRGWELPPIFRGE